MFPPSYSSDLSCTITGAFSERPLVTAFRRTCIDPLHPFPPQPIAQNGDPSLGLTYPLHVHPRGTDPQFIRILPGLFSLPGSLADDLIRSRLPPFTRQHVFSDGHIRFGFDRYPANGMFNFALILVRLGYLSLANLDR